VIETRTDEVVSYLEYILLVEVIVLGFVELGPVSTNNIRLVWTVVAKLRAVFAVRSVLFCDGREG